MFPNKVTETTFTIPKLLHTVQCVSKLMALGVRLLVERNNSYVFIIN